VADPEFVKLTIQVWQQRSQKKLSEEDATVIIRNMTTFLQLLLEWERAENSRSEDGEINCSNDPQ
jgi:hypothetical protein